MRRKKRTMVNERKTSEMSKAAVAAAAAVIAHRIQKATMSTTMDC